MKYSFLLAPLCAVALAGRASAQYALEATLDEWQFVPPNAFEGTGFGNGTFVLTPTTNTLQFDILAFPFGTEASSHIHLGEPGQAGPAHFTLPPGHHKVGSWNYPEFLEPSILQGFMYVDVHLVQARGSLRGQIHLQGVPALPHVALVVLVVLALAGGIVVLRRSSSLERRVSASGP